MPRLTNLPFSNMLRLSSLAAITAFICIFFLAASPVSAHVGFQQKQDGRLVRRVDLSKISAYYSPPSSYSSSSSTSSFKSQSVSGSTQLEVALNYIADKLNLTVDVSTSTFSTDSNGVSVSVTSSYTDDHNGVFHLYATQTLKGVAFSNSHISVNVDKDLNILTYGTNVVDVSSLSEVTPSSSARRLRKRSDGYLDALDAVVSFGNSIGESVLKSSLSGTDVNGDGKKFTISGVSFALDNVTATKNYYTTSSNTLEHTWSLAVEMENNWLSAQVSATTGEVLGVADWVSNSLIPRYSRVPGAANIAYLKLDTKPKSLSTRQLVEGSVKNQGTIRSTSERQLGKRQSGITTNYRVVPIGSVDINDGGRKLVTDPEDLTFSQLGWHDFGQGRGPQSTSAGNNVIAVQNPAGVSNAINQKRASPANFDFDFSLDDKTQDPTQYVNASITNMFFVANSVHDIFYAYGFTESAGNFQFDNFNKGGSGNDPVVASAQDGTGTNNANFATPADGQAGRMRMFIFTLTNPRRDGALDNDIVAHEMTHGLSNRLVGGSANANCLTTTEAGGLGEGWSDFMGVSFRLKATDTRNTDIAVGAYAVGSDAGVRAFLYSTNTTTNPETFSFLNRNDVQADVHRIGEIFNNMLYEVYWNLVDKLGFTSKYKDDAKSGKGNTVMIQLVVDSFKLLPCNPTMVNARDAILSADAANNNSSNKCEIWKGFAKRGLGFGIKTEPSFGQYVDDFTVDPSCN